MIKNINFIIKIQLSQLKGVRLAIVNGSAVTL